MRADRRGDALTLLPDTAANERSAASGEAQAADAATLRAMLFRRHGMPAATPAPYAATVVA